MGRTLAVGDIHGALKALKQVLAKAKVTPEDHIIFLGDYVDGWSESAQVIDFLIELKSTHNITLLRGNHDDLAYQWLTERKHNESWLFHGGKATVQSYEGYSKAHIEIHKRFFESLDNYIILPSNKFFAHAGFQNIKGPEHEYHEITYYWDRTLWELACATDKNLSPDDPLYPKRLTIFDEMYIGHTPLTRIGRSVPTQMMNVWNVDTGAAYKNPLSIIDVDTKEYWQSDPVNELYPDENGRN